MCKKFTSLLIVTFIIINICAVSAFAETAPSVTIGTATGKTGDTVEIPVILSGNTGFSSLNIEIYYNSNALSLINVNKNNSVGGNVSSSQLLSKTPYMMSWNSATEVNTFNGTLATLSFEILTDVNEIYTVEVNSYKGRTGDYVDGQNVNFIIDESGSSRPIDLTYANGFIEVKNYVEKSLLIGPNGNVSVNGELDNGELYVSVYNKNKDMKDFKIYPLSNNLTINLDSYETGDIIKVAWIGEDLKPVCKTASVIVR